MLGAILLEGRSALTRVAAALQPADFYTDAHRTIFAAMCALEAAHQPLDLITLAAELGRREDLKTVGGEAKLAALVEQAALAVHLDSYTSIVRDCGVRREAIQASVELMSDGYETTQDVEGLVDKADTRIRALKARLVSADGAGAPRHLSSVLDRVVTDLEGDSPAKIVGTPFPSLNQFLAGGFLPGELVYLGGYAGFGKTAMALEIATAAAARGHGVLVVSREMLVEALGRRLLSQHAHVPALALRAGYLSETEWDLIRGALPKLRGLPVWLTDRVSTISQIEALARMVRERHVITLLVVDYLQLIRGGRGITDKRLEVEHVSGALKALAVDEHLVVLCLSAMARRERGARNRRPEMADLRETGRLEHDADIILLGWRRDMTAPETELIVAKGRDVKTGVIDLLFFGATLTFEEQSNRQPGDEPPF